MTRTECDNCRTLAEFPAPSGWVIVAVTLPDESEGYGPGAETAGMFCGWKCTAEYAAVKALVPAEDPQGGAS